MPSIIEIILQAQDQTGPGFASAQANLTGFQLAASGAQTGIVRLGQSTTAAANQTGTGLARIEQRAEGAESAIITLGIAGSTTATRMRSLGIQIQNQEQALVLTERRLHDVAAAHDADSLAVGRAQLAYDRLNRALLNNRDRMNDLKRSGDVTGIQVLGAGGGAAAAGGAGGAAAAGLGAGIGGVQGAAAAFGLTLGAAEIVRFGTDAIQASNKLQDTQTTLRGLTGTTERYNEAVSAARSNQRLFGGSLDENLTGLQGMATLSRSAAVGIDDLNKTSQLLSFKSPDQGAMGAMVALSELLTGEGAESTRSLQLRYELPANALKAIAAAPDPTAKLKALNDLLGDQGITAETLTGRLDDTSQAYRDLGIAADDARTGIGNLLGRALEPEAVQLTGLLKILTGDFKSGIGDVYTGGNMAAGYSRKDAEARVPAMFRTTPASATVAPGMAAPAAGPVTNVTVNVAGNVTAERDLTDRIRRNLIQIGRQNGINPVTP